MAELKLTREQSEFLVNSERVWVSVEIGNLPDFNSDPNAVAIIWILPTLVNSGRTVARIKKIAIRQHQIPILETLPAEPTYTGERDFDFILPPDKTIQITSGSTGITPQEFLAANQDQVRLYIYGFVDYFTWRKQEAERAGLGFKLPTVESLVGLLGLPKRQKSRLKKVA